MEGDGVVHMVLGTWDGYITMAFRRAYSMS